MGRYLHDLVAARDAAMYQHGAKLIACRLCIEVVLWLGAYLYEVLAVFSMMLNALFVNLIRYRPTRESLCAGCGRSMDGGGWASRVMWPAWFVRHCRDEQDAS